MNKSQHILIVEDSRVQLALYTEIFASTDYIIHQASNGVEALRLVDEIHPDLVLLDVMLPDINGIDVCKRIKNNPALNSTSIILFSADRVDSNSQVLGMESGADDYLVKPVDSRELLARVAALFRLRGMEHDIRQSHMELHQVLSSIMSVLIVIDRNGLVQRWNSVATSTLGIGFDQAFQQPLESLDLPWDHDRVVRAVRTCRESMTGVVLEDVRYQRPDVPVAQSGYLKLNIAPLLATSVETMGGLIVLGEDVSERRLLESQLLQAQKLESIGQLAAGIAHEINTPVQFVGDNMRFLQEAFAELGGMIQACDQFLRIGLDQGISAQAVQAFHKKHAAVDLEYLLREIPQAIEQSQIGLDRVAHIVQSMKSFSHPGELSMVMADINKALTDTITVSRNEWKYVAEVRMDLDPNMPQVLCYLSELNQAFLNIVTNAAQAIAVAHGEHAKDKGLITVSTRTDDNWIEVRVSDNGPGIPPDVFPRLFDPFFTTKEVGKGTGQGLVIVHNAVVKRHGGTVHVESEPGQGATFIIRLPMAPAEDAKPRSILHEEPLPDRTFRG
jgi:two-component system, NtrC family, sensor kinase